MALLINKCVAFTVLPEIKDAEVVFCKLLYEGRNIVLGCVYRSPNSVDECISAIHDYMQCHAHGSRIALMGDFNLPDINWNDMYYSSAASDALFDLMLTFNLRQVVSRPTRSQGTSQSILDLILISHHFDINYVRTDVIHGISDHDVPVCVLPLVGITAYFPVSIVTDFQNADDNSILTYLDHEFQPFSQMGSNASVFPLAHVQIYRPLLRH